MSTETITWIPAAEQLPDAELTVLCSGAETGVFDGFLDGTDEAGKPVWRDVTAMPVYDVTHWAELPKGPQQ
jgi:hypothetical protein